jgi:hypothetical protein
MATYIHKKLVAFSHCCSTMRPAFDWPSEVETHGRTITTDNGRNRMKLRFKVDQAECLRAGIDCPKSIVTVEVDPAKLTQEQRNLLADRLAGIDVCQLWNSDKGTEKLFTSITTDEVEAGKFAKPVLIVARRPTFDGLMDAVKENQAGVHAALERHREIAFDIASAGQS